MQVEEIKRKDKRNECKDGVRLQIEERKRKDKRNECRDVVSEVAGWKSMGYEEGV